MTLRQEVTELLQELIRLDTVNPPGNETRAAEVLDAATSRGTASRRALLAKTPDRANVVARLEGGDGPGPRPAGPHGHGARRAVGVGTRPVVGRPRRRRGLGSWRARHEGPRRGGGGRLRLAGAGGRPAAGRRRPRAHRRRGGRRRLRRVVARARASGHRPRGLRAQRGRRRAVRLRRAHVLPLRGRGEGDRAVQAAPARPQRACVRPACGGQRAAQGRHRCSTRSPASSRRAR